MGALDGRKHEAGIPESLTRRQYRTASAISSRRCFSFISNQWSVRKLPDVCTAQDFQRFGSNLVPTMGRKTGVFRY